MNKISNDLVVRRAINSDIPQIQNLIRDNLEANLVSYESGFVQSEFNIATLNNTFVIDRDKEIISVCTVRSLEDNDVNTYGITVNYSKNSLYIGSLCTNP